MAINPPTSPPTGGPKLVVVTGGSQGIGKAVCLYLASKGYKVALNYYSEAQYDDAMAILDEIQKDFGDNNEQRIAEAFQADVSNPDQVQEMFAKIVDTFQCAPTALVNNAGVMEPMEKDILKVDKEIVLRDFHINTFGSFLCTKEFVKYASTAEKDDCDENEGTTTSMDRSSIKGRGGSIVCVSSVSAASAEVLGYGMSKAALEAMVIGLSKSLPLLHGIRINTIVPGLIDTPIVTSKEVLDIMSNQFIPMRRAGNTLEIAKAIEFLLNDDMSSYCSGAKLKVSGGL